MTRSPDCVDPFPPSRTTPNDVDACYQQRKTTPSPFTPVAAIRCDDRPKPHGYDPNLWTDHGKDGR